MRRDWEAVTRVEFDRLFARDRASLTASTRGILERLAVPVVRVACLRSSQAGVEQVFILARRGNRVILYDDVEEEYAVGILAGNQVMSWDLVGGLGNALGILDDSDVSA